MKCHCKNNRDWQTLIAEWLILLHKKYYFQIVIDGTPIDSIPFVDPNVRNLVAEVSTKV